jgi:hypothetical protein
MQAPRLNTSRRIDGASNSIVTVKSLLFRTAGTFTSPPDELDIYLILRRAKNLWLIADSREERKIRRLLLIVLAVRKHIPQTCHSGGAGI